MAEENRTIDINEATILGNILFDNTGNQMLTAVQHLSAEDFTDPRNRAVYQAMLEINSHGETPDMALVVETLKNDKTFDSIGGLDYLNDIANNTARIASIDAYIKRIKDKGLLKKFLAKCKDVVDVAQTQPIEDVSEYIGRAETEINEIAKERSIKEASRLAEVSPQLVEKWVKQSKRFREEGIEPTGITGVKTGYEPLDKLTRGWNPGQLIVIGARPSVGKTAFTLNLLYNVAKEKKPVIFFSLEMKAVSIEMRLLELASDLTSDEINRMDFAQNSTPDRLVVNVKSKEESAKVSKLQSGMNLLAEMPFYIDENPGTTVDDIAAKCRKLIKGQNINASLVAIDYLGLIEPSKKSAGDSRTNQVAEISRSLKKLANELEIPIIALSQLSRDSAKRGTDHKPILTDLRDSGALEQDADMVFFLYRPDYFGDDKKEDGGAPQPQEEEEHNPISSVDLLIAKNREGALGEVKFVFDKPHCHFAIRADDRFNDEMPFGV